jgi:hypothetical protein
MVSMARRRIVNAAVAAALAAIVAGCSSTAAPTTPGGTGPSGAPTATVASGTSAAASHAPVTQVPVVGATANPVLAGVAAALTGLTSYQYEVTIVGSPYGKVLGDTGMTGTVVNRPSFAVQFKTSYMEIIELQDGKNWSKNGSSWDLSPSKALSTNYDTFGPPNQISHLFSPSTAAYFVAAGDETVNGVPTTHYQCPNQRAMNFFSGVEGISGDASWTADMWIAKTGGYPVRFKIAASGTASFSLGIDITKANDPANVVHVPAG